MIFGYRVRYKYFGLFCEILALITAWYITFFLRLALNPLMSRRLTQSQLQESTPPLAGMILLWILMSIWIERRSYSRIILGGQRFAAYSSVFESAGIAGITTIIVTFFFREVGAHFSRSFVLLYMPVSVLTLMAARRAGESIIRASKSTVPARERVALIGAGPDAISVINRIRAADPIVDFRGIILPACASGKPSWSITPILGLTSELAQVINRERLDRIVVANDDLTSHDFEQCMHIARTMGIVLNRALSTAADRSKVELKLLYDLPFMELRPLPYNGTAEAVKRMIDIVVSLICLVLLLPLFGVIAALIKLTSRGPVFYRSRRVGRGGRHFTFLKFRSMRSVSEVRDDVAHFNEKNGHLFKIRNDPRVTRLGRFLRRYSLDELPQLINVLTGEMSIVGPRPLPAEDLDGDGHSQDFREWARTRSRVLPGITGLWQIRGRSDLDFHQMVQLDMQYIENWSLGLDILILLQTPGTVLGGRGAY